MCWDRERSDGGSLLLRREGRLCLWREWDCREGGGGGEGEGTPGEGEAASGPGGEGPTPPFNNGRVTPCLSVTLEEELLPSVSDDDDDDDDDFTRNQPEHVAQ